MRRKFCLFGVAAILAILIAFPGSSSAALWFGGELGMNMPLDSTFKVNGYNKWDTSFDAALIGGATVGYDFINSGLFGHNWPGWMKYFSVATDITFNRHNVYSQSEGLGQFIAPQAKVTGYEVTWSFMFIGHYGFRPDSEVPSGRIKPYLGIGPAIVFNGLNLNGLRSSPPVLFGNFNNRKGYTSSTNIALVVEPGIRWMALNNVSIDTFLRYRFYNPSYDVGDVHIKSDGLHQLALMLRANYHF